MKQIICLLITLCAVPTFMYAGQKTTKPFKHSLSNIEKIIETNDRQLVNQADSDGYTPLEFVIVTGNTEYLQDLLNLEPNDDMDDLFELAIQSNNTEAVKFLLNNGANFTFALDFLLKKLNSNDTPNPDKALYASFVSKIIRYSPFIFSENELNKALPYLNDTTKKCISFLQKGARIEEKLLISDARDYAECLLKFPNYSISNFTELLKITEK